MPAMKISSSTILPQNNEVATLVGRAWLPGRSGGPTPVALREGSLYDLSRVTATSSGLLNAANPVRLVRDAIARGWAKPVADVYNIIRAANPAPGAWTTLNGNEVQIYDSARADGDGTPGEVVSVNDDGVTVQAAGGRIVLKRVRPKGGDKQPAADWAKAAGVEARTKLGG